ncbi:MAG: hypothetical protein ACLSAH_13065 [Bilophila wadsworthia]
MVPRRPFAPPERPLPHPSPPADKGHRHGQKKIFLVSLGHLSCDINGGALPAIPPDHRVRFRLSSRRRVDVRLLLPLLDYSTGFRLSVRQAFQAVVHSRGRPAGRGGLASIGFLHSYWAIFAAIALSGVGAALFHPEGARFANKVSGASGAQA